MKQVPFQPLDTFAQRHIGPRGDDIAAMLKEVGASSIDQLIDEAIPPGIRLKAPLNLPPAESESAYLARLKTIVRQQQIAAGGVAAVAAPAPANASARARKSGSNEKRK